MFFETFLHIMAPLKLYEYYEDMLNMNKWPQEKYLSWQVMVENNEEARQEGLVMEKIWSLKTMH